MAPIYNFTHVACSGIPLPQHDGQGLELWHVLSLINARSGIILGSDGTRISVPFTVEQDEQGFYLRSHFPAYRSGLVKQIEQEGKLNVLFDCAECYIDPEWVLRETPHAPTEVKVVFSVGGSVKFINCSQEDAVDHLDKVTRFRQLRFQPLSKFSVKELPDNYYADQLPQILHLKMRLEFVDVSQVMALLHLIPEHRGHIINKLDEKGDSQSLEAAQILRFFCGCI